MPPRVLLLFVVSVCIFWKECVAAASPPLVSAHSRGAPPPPAPPSAGEDGLPRATYLRPSWSYAHAADGVGGLGAAASASAADPPLGPKAGVAPVALHVLLMTYRRPASALRVLGQVLDAFALAHHSRHDDAAAAGGGVARAPLRIVVAQSCESESAPYVLELAAGLRAAIGPRVASLEHVLTPMTTTASQRRRGGGGGSGGDGSFSNDRVLFGSKRNSVGNLLHGLDTAFGDFRAPGGARAALVLEDDAVLSADALAYFAFAARELADDPRLRFATAMAQFRPGLLFGARDVEAHFGRTLAPTAAAAAAAAAPVDAPGGSPVAGHRSETDAPRARLVERFHGTPRTIFKTYAWMLSAGGFSELRGALVEAFEFDVPPAVAAYTAAAAAEIATAASEGGAPLVLRSPAFRTAQPAVAGCLWCHDHCYDHVIEWLLQGQPFLSPFVPRVQQASGRGMSYAANEVLPFHTGAPVRANEFELVEHSAFSALQLLALPGLSAIAPEPPAELRELLLLQRGSGEGGADGRGAAAETPEDEDFRRRRSALLVRLNASVTDAVENPLGSFAAIASLAFQREIVVQAIVCLVAAVAIAIACVGFPLSARAGSSAVHPGGGGGSGASKWWWGSGGRGGLASQFLSLASEQKRR